MGLFKYWRKFKTSIWWSTWTKEIWRYAVDSKTLNAPCFPLPTRFRCASWPTATKYHTLSSILELHAWWRCALFCFWWFYSDDSILQYGEFRTGLNHDKEDTRIVVFGIRFIVEKILNRRWTLKELEKAEKFYRQWKTVPISTRLWHNNAQHTSSRLHSIPFSERAVQKIHHWERWSETPSQERTQISPRLLSN